MLRIAAVLLSISVFALADYAAAADPADAAGRAAAAQRNKVVIQVSDGDPAKWNLALTNATNVQADLGQGNVDIEIVAYGPGLSMIRLESPVGERVRESIASGVRIVACESTMTNLKLSREDMLPSLVYVHAGVVELMVRQQQGYAYIRP